MDKLKGAAQALMRDHVLCILPWTHLHVRTNGDAHPCCAWRGPPLGNLRAAPPAAAWNSPRMKALRRDMLKGNPTAGCRDCYRLERSKSLSLRQEKNQFLAGHMDRIKLTAPDGELPALSLPLLDIRFSNVCNLKCRTCGPEQSSAWADDARKLGAPAVGHAVRRAYEDWDVLLRQLEPLLEEGLEEIVFAGGEALVMEEHYRVLDFLLRKKLHGVRLHYITNFSTLHFKGWDILDLWSRFEKVKVAASLDGSGRRGEYLRKGLNWDAVVSNREEMLKRCPGAEFNVSATLSAFNALHLPDFHREWTRRGYVKRDDFIINPLLEPEQYCAQVLPPAMKRRAVQSYRRHRAAFPRACRAAREFAAAERFLAAKDAGHLLPGFVRMTRRLDSLRGESCARIFPELAELFD